MESLNFTGAFDSVKKVVKLGNNLLSVNEFWKLAKADSTETDKTKLNDLFYCAFEISRVSSHLIKPFCPSLSDQMLGGFLNCEP